MADNDAIPKPQHHFLIAGCGRDGRPENFTFCHPESGQHTFNHYKILAPYIANLPGGAHKLITHAPITEDHEDDGNIPTPNAFTVNPSKLCKPHLVSPFTSCGPHLIGNKFSMVHLDHCDDLAGLANLQHLKNTLTLSMDLLHPGGVVYWNVFQWEMRWDGGKWIYKPNDGKVAEKTALSMGDYEHFIHHLNHHHAGKWTRTWKGIYDNDGDVVEDPEKPVNISEGDLGIIEGFIVAK